MVQLVPAKSLLEGSTPRQANLHRFGLIKTAMPECSQH